MKKVIRAAVIATSKAVGKAAGKILVKLLKED